MYTLTRRLRAAQAEDGFTLIEVIAALAIFGVVSVAVLPLVMTGLKASGKTRIETLAKDLSQLRLERMRNLQFHVDRQNGPYVDLLDSYYTNATGAVTATSESNCSGQYLAAAPGTGGAPAGAAYRVTCATLPEATGFSQTVYTQFLKRTGVTAPVPSTYNSQTVGFDESPSQLIGITVLTSWNRAGQTGTLRTYTEVAEARGTGALITTQAEAVALRVSSTSTAANLVAVAGQVKADGSLTSGSIAAVQAIGARLEQSGATPISGAVGSAVAPPNPSGTSGTVNVDGISPVVATGDLSFGSWVGCGWGWFGRNAHANASATTELGVPSVPADAGSDATPVGAPRSQAGLVRNGSGCQGYAFGFRNWLTTPTFGLGLNLSTANPQVYLKDETGGGSLTAGLSVGSASVAATDILDAARSASSVATARSTTVYILPTGDRPNGLVTATLTSSRITCKSTGAAAASYDLTVTYPGPAVGQTISRNITYTSGSPVSGSLPDPATVIFLEGGISRTLAEYLDWDVSAGVEESASGARAIDHIFNLSVPETVVGNGGFGVQLGSLSCAAADNR